MENNFVNWQGKRIRVGLVFKTRQIGVIDSDNLVLFILSVNTEESRFLPKDHYYFKCKGENQSIIPFLEQSGLIMKVDSFMPYRNTKDLLFAGIEEYPVYCLTSSIQD